MAYILQWKNPAVDPGKVNITVPVGGIVNNAASLTFTGKGSANYGKVQQENLMRLLENFADGTAPAAPTVGQLWYDTTATVLKLCTSTVPTRWRTLAGIQVTNVGDAAPASPSIGDLWFERTGPLSGNLYVYNKVGRFPLTNPAVNGGWSQIWPEVDAAALRDEYDLVDSYLRGMLNDSILAGGIGAVGRYLTNITDFGTLDTNYASIYTATPDANISSNGVTADLRVQPVSSDWDTLLAAGRWAMSRLDLPATLVDDISTIPFVQDGRPAPASLLNLPTNDIRYPAPERLSMRRYGLVTMVRSYAETLNVLQTAFRSRYVLRGMSETSGAYSTFAPDVVTSLHSRRAGNFVGGSVSGFQLFRFNNQDELSRFICGGSAIEVRLDYTPSGSSPADADWSAFVARYGRFRVTADATRALYHLPVQGLVDSPTATGLLSAVASASDVVLTFRSFGSSSFSLRGRSISSGSFNIGFGITTPGGLTGTTTVTFAVIRDATAYGPSDLDLIPAPLAFNAPVDAGTSPSVLFDSPLSAAPTANFSVNALSGTTSTSFAFTWTGTGSPTLIEWDLDGSGTFTSTGTTATTTYSTKGKKTVRVRATNAVGQDVLTRVSYITVT